MYYVYILECNDKTLYVGSTSDLGKRIHAHNHLKSGAHYTKIRRPVVLVYQEECEDYSSVRRREGELKRLTRMEKFQVIKSTLGVKNMLKSPNVRTSLQKHRQHPPCR